MPDIFEDAVNWFEHRHDRHHTPPAPGPVTLAAEPPKENPVSLSSDLHAIAGRLENLGEEAVTGLERVNANPETAKVFAAITELTGLNVAPGIISIVAAGLDELVSRLKAAVPAPADQPAAQASFTAAGAPAEPSSDPRNR